ncbi:PEP/pyruvate-binding domain-containing protein, partial [Thermodesulfobacteriota bacterium]
FAGQHETYYYVEADHLLQMVKHCWASLWSPEAVSYRSIQGIDHASVFMAVIVQEMIQSIISGVTFTANPVTGDRDVIMTESSWGMGAAIVDGRVTPDHYVTERKGLKLREKRIGEKKYMVPVRLEEGGSRLLEVPHHMRRQETLSADMVRTVAEWAIKAEEHFGSAQDIEWAIADDQFYMLQSRPVTIMGHEDITEGVKGKYVIFKPLIENFTDPLTPLTGDLMSLLFAPPVMQLIRGWAYLSLKHLKAILPFRVSDEALASLMYDWDANSPKMKISLRKLPFSLMGLVLGYLMFGVLFARTRRIPTDFMDRFRDLARSVDRDPAYGPLETLVRLVSWSRFFDPVGMQVLLVNFTAIRYILGLALLQKLMRRWVHDLREDAEALLCSGTEGVLSAEMGRGIWALAKEAKKRPAVRELLEKTRPDKVLANLRAEPEAEEFLNKLGRFLSKNGHRALKELELQSVRWEENPTPVLGMIRNYLLVESDPSEHERKIDQIRKDLEEEIRQKLEKYPFERLFRPRWRLIRYTASRIKFFARMRENSRFYHIMAFYIVRKKVLRLEEELIGQGKLRCKGDIFFLHWPELARMQAGELGWLEVEDRIRDRRMEHIRLSKMVPPKTIGVKLMERDETEKRIETTGDALTGQAASPGGYEGVAHVILDPSIDIELKPGEVLVAPYTDPAWTPLFLTAGAAVVEVGSYLSHAGTVAREFGMPCVVDVHDCTARIHSGVRLNVDGDNGLVRILKAEGDESE